MSGFVDAVLNVLTIVALISATAFIIIFLVDLLMSITNKHGAIFFRKSADSVEEKPKVAEPQPEPVEEEVRPQVLSQEESKEKTWDEEAAQRELQEIEQNKVLNQSDEQELLEAKQKDIDASDDSKRQKLVDDFDDFDSLFDNEPAKDAIEPGVGFDEMINEINKESVTKYEASRKAEVVEPVKEILEPVKTKEDEDFGIKFDSQDELDDFEKLFETKDQTETSTTTTTTTETENTTPMVLPAPVDTTPVEATKADIINVYEYFPKEALDERLAKLQERLKNNERELKANRKEYTPLQRVNRSLKRDQEKLRRREAIVARKKVMLYGVNNYVDIDEEKAKKLSEDLDLLDGLRLSVQHCEEVMEQNKDRFPILERTNKILLEQNKQIKEDIEEVKAAIEKLNNE